MYNKTNKKSVRHFFTFIFLMTFMCLPQITFAKTIPPLEISGWIPYWKTATGTADAIAHIDTFKEISPFGFTVKNNGFLFDPMHIQSDPWQDLIKKAHAKKVRVIPTVMWSDGDAIDKVLSDPELRKRHIQAIVAMVNWYNFDGVDIDYEGKKAETKDSYSLFLRDLYKAMGQKFVVCTIEPRTPLTDRFDKIPADIQYANDFKTINKYCDRVRIMAYDQGLIDLRLNKTANGPYNPIADTVWVEKVINLAAKDISKKKIIIGVPTYGHEYLVTPLTQGYRYDFKGSFNQKYALDIAKNLNITPTRNRAGELSFTYTPTSTTQTVDLPLTTPSNNLSISTSSVSTNTLSASSTQPFMFLSWSDASAIHDKVVLAKKLGVRGIAIFKIDGGEDPTMWSVLK